MKRKERVRWKVRVFTHAVDYAHLGVGTLQYVHDWEQYSVVHTGGVKPPAEAEVLQYFEPLLLLRIIKMKKIPGDVTPHLFQPLQQG